MRAQVGDRVVAIRNGSDDGTTLYSYGRGVYAGPQTVPYWNPDAPMSDGMTFRAFSEAIITQEMSQPQSEFLMRGEPTGMDQYGNPMGDTRTFAERVDAHLHAWGSNPRIDLDAGGSAFGYFCWWCPEEQYERMLVGKTEVLVPLPDPLPHSMITRHLGEAEPTTPV